MQSVKIERPDKIDFRTSEAYKSLRTNIELCGKDIRHIAITSCTPNEGKSEVSFQLAISLAQAGKKVLFLDGDLRKSVIAGRYHIHRAVDGFTHYLAGQKHFDKVVYATDIENLHVVFSGPVPPNPAELLGGEAFHELMASLDKVYDYVIVDTPPLGSVIDSAVIARECDGVVMVLSASTISYKFAQKVKEQLQKTGCPILGVVLNKVPIKGKGYYGKYYGKYYGSYYGSEEK